MWHMPGGCKGGGHLCVYPAALKNSQSGIDTGAPKVVAYQEVTGLGHRSPSSLCSFPTSTCCWVFPLAPDKSR